MLKIELTDKFKGPAQYVILSDAKTVQAQEEELEPLRVLGMIATSSIQLVHLQHGCRAIRWFPQTQMTMDALERLCIQLNEDQEADARHKRAEEL